MIKKIHIQLYTLDRFLRIYTTNLYTSWFMNGDPTKVDKTTKINMHPLITDVNLDKHDIGLSQVDNLSLVNSINQMNTNVGVINASIDALTYSLQQKVDKSLAINGQTIGNSTNVLVGMSSLNQTIFNSKEDRANKNIPNGYAGLDSSGQLPQSVFPSNTGMLSYKGIWDASLNVPTLSDSSIEPQGSYYIVSFSGTTQLNNINEWNVDDWIISNGTSWLKISNSDKVTSVNSQTGNVVIDKSSVGLSNVDNTADLSKPISTATQTALDLKESISNRNQANGYAGLDSSGKLNSSLLNIGLSDLNIGKVFESLFAKLTYGDINNIQQTHVNNITNPGSPTTYSILPTTYLMWQNSTNLSDLYMPDPSLYAYSSMIYARVGYDYQLPYFVTLHGAVNNSSVQINNGNIGLFYTDSTQWYFLAQLNQSIFFDMIKAVPESRQINGNTLSNDIILDKYSIGLPNVDNTSDINKPISTLQQSALDSKESISNRNQPNGYAGLDSNGKLVQSQIDSISIDTLSDVVITNAQTNQILQYNGTEWINATSTGGGGGGGLTSTDVVAGTGEGTSSVPDIYIRGAQASGANVKAGDLIIRAPGGTGLMGSGSIRFQTAAPLRSTYLLPFTGYMDISLANTFSTSTSITLLNTGKIANVLAIVLCTSNASITTFTLGGIAHTPLYSQSVGSGRFIASSFMNVPAANATGTCTVNTSTRMTVRYMYFDPNDWDGTITTGQSSTPTTTAASVTFSDLLKGDLIFTCAIQIYPWSGTATNTIPGEKPMSSLNNVTTGGSPYVVAQYSATRVLEDQASYIMTTTYSTNITNVGYVGFYLRYKPSTDTTIPTFVDSVVISPYGQLSHILDSMYFLPAQSTNLFSVPFVTLTAQSPRTQNFSFTPTPTSGNQFRTIILPDPRTLNIGCTFTITLPAYNYLVNGNWAYLNIPILVPNITADSQISSSTYIHGKSIISNSAGSGNIYIELKVCDDRRSIWECTSGTSISIRIVD